jgi:hypothetical protein
MSTTAKLDRWGSVRWTSHFYDGYNGKRNARGNLYLMAYEIVGIEDNSRYRDTVDGIVVTNGTCDGKGWDVVLFGEVVAHEQYKRDAQRTAEDVL